MLKLLETGEAKDKVTIINTLLNRVVVYKDRIEIFINILPYEDAAAEMLITNDDLSTYGLLETDDNEKIAPKDDFPSDNSIGTPVSRRKYPTIYAPSPVKPAVPSDASPA